MVGEVLTWEQIRDLYDGEWVLLEDPQTGEDMQADALPSISAPVGYQWTRLQNCQCMITPPKQ